MNNSITVQKYISEFPKEVKERLEIIRNMVKEELPQAEEKISYGMPTYFQKKNIFHFAGYKNHIGIYPTPSGIKSFRDEFEKSKLKYSVGALQIPHNIELPIKLIKKIIQYRKKEVLK